MITGIKQWKGISTGEHSQQPFWLAALVAAVAARDAV